MTESVILSGSHIGYSGFSFTTKIVHFSPRFVSLALILLSTGPVTVLEYPTENTELYSGLGYFFS